MIVKLDVVEATVPVAKNAVAKESDETVHWRKCCWTALKSILKW